MLDFLKFFQSEQYFTHEYSKIDGLSCISRIYIPKTVTAETDAYISREKERKAGRMNELDKDEFPISLQQWATGRWVTLLFHICLSVCMHACLYVCK